MAGFLEAELGWRAEARNYNSEIPGALRARFTGQLAAKPALSRGGSFLIFLVPQWHLSPAETLRILLCSVCQSEEHRGALCTRPRGMPWGQGGRVIPRRTCVTRGEKQGVQRGGGRPRDPTSEATGVAHGSKDRRLHLNVADAGRVGCPQVLLLVLFSVGAECPVQAALPWKTVEHSARARSKHPLHAHPTPQTQRWFRARPACLPSNIRPTVEIMRSKRTSAANPQQEPRAPLTLIEVQGAHGVAHDCGELAELRGAARQLLHQLLVQVRVPDLSLPEDNLLELRLKARVHCLPGDDHGAGLQT